MEPLGAALQLLFILEQAQSVIRGQALDASLVWLTMRKHFAKFPLEPVENTPVPANRWDVPCVWGKALLILTEIGYIAVENGTIMVTEQGVCAAHDFLIHQCKYALPPELCEAKYTVVHAVWRKDYSNSWQEKELHGQGHQRGRFYTGAILRTGQLVHLFNRLWGIV